MATKTKKGKGDDVMLPAEWFEEMAVVEAPQFKRRVWHELDPVIARILEVAKQGKAVRLKMTPQALKKFATMQMSIRGALAKHNKKMSYEKHGDYLIVRAVDVDGASQASTPHEG